MKDAFTRTEYMKVLTIYIYKGHTEKRSKIIQKENIGPMKLETPCQANLFELHLDLPNQRDSFNGTHYKIQS